MQLVRRVSNVEGLAPTRFYSKQAASTVSSSHASLRRDARSNTRQARPKVKGLGERGAWPSSKQNHSSHLCRRHLSNAASTKQPIRVTELGHESQYRISQTTEIPIGVPNGSQHVLVVEPGFKEPRTAAEMQMITDLVKEDGVRGPPIDSVVFRRKTVEQGDVFSPFRDLRPHCLVIESAHDDTTALLKGPLEGLSVLQSHWPIEHLHISNRHSFSMESGGGHLLPSFGETVTSLVLQNCTGYLGSTIPFKKLREVTLLDGHACSLFIDLLIQCMEPNDRSMLKIARIQNAYSTGDYSESMDNDELTFIQALSLCDGLEELELNTSLVPADCDFDPFAPGVHFTNALSPSLQHLRFRGRTGRSGRVLDSHLPTKRRLWMKRAAKPGWLPNLKTLTFRLDHTGDEEERFGNKPPGNVLIPEVNTFLNIFKQSHPLVQIENTWYKIEL